MQTEQAATIEEHLHGFCCGKLEGKDVDVGTIIARHNKVFAEMFGFFFPSFCMHLNELPLPPHTWLFPPGNSEDEEPGRVSQQ